jgi:hypothetical protein
MLVDTSRPKTIKTVNYCKVPSIKDLYRFQYGSPAPFIRANRLLPALRVARLRRSKAFGKRNWGDGSKRRTPDAQRDELGLSRPPFLTRDQSSEEDGYNPLIAFSSASIYPITKYADTPVCVPRSLRPSLRMYRT